MRRHSRTLTFLTPLSDAENFDVILRIFSISLKSKASKSSVLIINLDKALTLHVDMQKMVGNGNNFLFLYVEVKALMW